MGGGRSGRWRGAGGRRRCRGAGGGGGFGQGERAGAGAWLCAVLRRARCVAAPTPRGRVTRSAVARSCGNPRAQRRPASRRQGTRGRLPGDSRAAAGGSGEGRAWGRATGAARRLGGAAGHTPRAARAARAALLLDPRAQLARGAALGPRATRVRGAMAQRAAPRTRRVCEVPRAGWREVVTVKWLRWRARRLKRGLEYDSDRGEWRAPGQSVQSREGAGAADAGRGQGREGQQPRLADEAAAVPALTGYEAHAHAGAMGVRGQLADPRAAAGRAHARGPGNSSAAARARRAAQWVRVGRWWGGGRAGRGWMWITGGRRAAGGVRHVRLVRKEGRDVSS